MASTTVTCPHCGAKSQAETWSLINVGDNAELKQRVKDGSLFVWECPSCGRRNLLGCQPVYHDPQAKLMIWVLPQSEDEKAVAKAKMETLGRQIGDAMEGYALRCVSDIGSLIEKVNIRDAGLEDTIVEMCKYVTKMEMAENLKDPTQVKSLEDSTFRFYRMSGADNEIEFSFPQDGEMKTVKTGFNVYEDCRGIIARNPAMKPDSGFALIDADWIFRFFR